MQVDKNASCFKSITPTNTHTTPLASLEAAANHQRNHIMNETIQLFILALFALPTVFAIFAIWKGISE